ncbi:MAG: hypothetical protein ISS13_03440 [Actinobacteria bacterium]|nr:hypothetical protein [Actinomycetota bacterium]MBL7060872.1 hypothetical protein [Actinomycetota bacterium]
MINQNSIKISEIIKKSRSDVDKIMRLSRDRSFWTKDKYTEEDFYRDLKEISKPIGKHN